ncbi:unnamed protein product [Rodentolepis nana]|uniref:Uncharacterized protein n=1 Tax=Rodentolepis nana TaxID=102285 RepID=A0A3P7T3R1_RODNA|nr:unnamed protein product [Rodentolepis nana]
MNTEVKLLDKNIHEFGRQLEIWKRDISDVNSALKELGDTETWSKKLKHDSQLVFNVFQSINN